MLGFRLIWKNNMNNKLLSPLRKVKKYEKDNYNLIDYLFDNQF